MEEVDLTILEKLTFVRTKVYSFRQQFMPHDVTYQPSLIHYWSSQNCIEKFSLIESPSFLQHDKLKNIVSLFYIHSGKVSTD